MHQFLSVQPGLVLGSLRSAYKEEVGVGGNVELFGSQTAKSENSEMHITFGDRQSPMNGSIANSADFAQRVHRGPWPEHILSAHRQRRSSKTAPQCGQWVRGAGDRMIG